MENKSSMGRVERLRREKVTRYSIRKYSFGAASVAVAALFMFLGNGAVSVQAEEIQAPQVVKDNQTQPAPEHPSTAPESAPVHPTVEEPTKPAPAPDSPSTPAKPAGEELAKPALDTTKLEKYIAEIEAKLDNGTYSDKTDESIAALKEKIAAAKSTVVNAKTQAELTNAYNNLVTFANTGLKKKPVEKPESVEEKPTPEVDTTNGKETVGRRAENTEPKEGSNAIENTGSHDSRNGKLIENGSGFRAAVTPEHEEFTRTVVILLIQ